MAESLLFKVFRPALIIIIMYFTYIYYIYIYICKVNMEHKLDATITVLLIFKISSTCFGQTFAHLQERKTEIFLQHMV
jgi:hypothetical protein